MKIKEAAAAARLTERAVRLYEEKGLISPAVKNINGRDFREYGEEDVKRLCNIAALRRALFTLEEIREMQTSPESIPAIFTANRSRIHAEYMQLSYLVSKIDALDDDAVAGIKSPEQLSRAIFERAPLMRDEDKIDDIAAEESDRALFNEQYERIYSKYFDEDANWGRRYDTSLRVRKIFGKTGKIVIYVLCALVLFYIVAFGFNRIETVNATLYGFSLDSDGIEAYKDADNKNNVDGRAAAQARIVGKYKNYLLRRDYFEGLIYVDGYYYETGKIIEGDDGSFSTMLHMTDGTGLSIHDTTSGVTRNISNCSTGARDGDEKRCLMKIFFDYTLTDVFIVVLYPEENDPGSYIWSEDSRVISVSREDADAVYNFYMSHNEFFPGMSFFREPNM